MSEFSEMTAGECNALLSMMTGVPIEAIVAFAVVVVTEGAPGCECGRPEDHRGVAVSSSATDPLLASGILNQGIANILTAAAEEKYGGAT